jgi:hypothetical protein
MLWLLQVINFVAIIFISYVGTGLIAAYTPERLARCWPFTSSCSRC